MNIVYTFDDNYATVAAVSILSLLENNKKEKSLNIYIIDCGLSEFNKEKLLKLSYHYEIKIFYINGKNLESKIPIKLELRYWSFVCYVRLFFSELLPYLDKVIHIDCDTIVRGSLSNIYNLDIGDNLCAGCYDCIPTTKYMADIPKESKYYSNGLLIFNLKKMREECIQDKFIKYIIDQNGELPHLDQDVVNAVLIDRIKTLPPEYNMMTYITLFGEKCVEFFNPDDQYYTKSEINSACKNPKIVHLVGHRFVGRPWEQPCFHPYNEEWIDYYNTITDLFEDKKSLLSTKNKKRGFLFRKTICTLWSIGYKFTIFRKLEFIIEKRKVKRECKIYMKSKSTIC